MSAGGTGADSGSDTPSNRPEGGPRSRVPALLRASWWRDRTQQLTAWLHAVHARLESRFPVITGLVDRLVSVNIFDSATRIAAQCFLTAVPLLFVLGAYAPEAVQEQVATSVSAVFGLTGDTKAQVEQAFQSPTDDLRQATGLVGVLMVLLSATAVSRAVQRLCRRAWLLTRTEAKVAPWRWLAWIVLWLGALIVQGLLHNGFGRGAELGAPVILVIQVGMWWWTQHLLLGGAIRWPPLLPGAGGLRSRGFGLRPAVLADRGVRRRRHRPQRGRRPVPGAVPQTAPGYAEVTPRRTRGRRPKALTA